ncbi:MULTISPECIES: helix-turn-helix domain-containing protein [unclassified Pseudonocardia]|uniref:helix-turn-helix domain-containing protein n=1 Tax=unclassified Pseudonocardia TaxID=2619320 RepID=UPI001482B43A|nr:MULTISPECIES: helix-turn-helix transcriptional regulator [unclassified Pseudonocardia]
MDAAEGRDRRPQDFAGQLRRLIAVLHPPGRPALSDRAIAARVRELGGSISPAYVAELRSGAKTNPSLAHARQLAAAFGVSAGYFTDPEVFERVSAELDTIEEINTSASGNTSLVELATRTAQLDPDERATLAALVERELAARSRPPSPDSED